MDIKGGDNIGHSQMIPSECSKAASNVWRPLGRSKRVSDVVPSLNIPVKVIGLVVDDHTPKTGWGEVLDLPNGL